MSSTGVEVLLQSPDWGHRLRTWSVTQSKSVEVHVFSFLVHVCSWCKVALFISQPKTLFISLRYYCMWLLVTILTKVEWKMLVRFVILHPTLGSEWRCGSARLLSCTRWMRVTVCWLNPKNKDWKVLMYNVPNKADAIYPTMRLAQQRETNLFLILSEPPAGRTPVGQGVILPQFFICHTFWCFLIQLLCLLAWKHFSLFPLLMFPSSCQHI